MRARIDVVYCAGWDPQARMPVGTMTEDRARERDRAGEPYAVLLGGGGRRRALLQVSWRDHYLGVFLFDEQERRVRAYDYRELAAGLLHLRRYEEWRHLSPAEPEFEGKGWHFTLTPRTVGEYASAELRLGGCLEMRPNLPERHRTLLRARFGDWTAYADGRMLGFAADDALSLMPAAHEERPESPAGAWSVPRGARPRHLEALFTPGSRFADDECGVATVTASKTAGVLRLPTGSVIAADPGTLREGDEPFTVPVPPGEYPVVLATMTWDDTGWGETTAAMLRVLDRPTVSWELAVRPGQDTRLLGEREFYGFGVDSGTGSFLDAAGRGALIELCKEGVELGETTDPGTGANLVAYPSGMGDGSYPVWIGRTEEGEVTCMVADMLILRDAQPLPPTAPDPTAFLSPVPESDDPRPRPGNVGEASDFISAIIAEMVEFKEIRMRG
ncbi:DUF4241 domain-containing protein [Streptomyces sp. SID8352]|uniref:DUF4241 domain-containing protein n=1 Tax=Streptomyces sp. SID8352 TaxID=2690338 RepID=UPI00136BA622|nr:DUF4241 domain-containing protein [Streptomyces sp. SID8352]MYU22346.1 DUF4241 domain-containing protein [Streptomyces sp. SID8352]